jgi:hypothetical protein
LIFPVPELRTGAFAIARADYLSTLIREASDACVGGDTLTQTNPDLCESERPENGS